jgi:hypothetical protein
LPSATTAICKTASERGAWLIPRSASARSASRTDAHTSKAAISVASCASGRIVQNSTNTIRQKGIINRVDPLVLHEHRRLQRKPRNTGFVSELRLHQKIGQLYAPCSISITDLFDGVFSQGRCRKPP